MTMRSLFAAHAFGVKAGAKRVPNPRTALCRKNPRRSIAVPCLCIEVLPAQVSPLYSACDEPVNEIPRVLRIVDVLESSARPARVRSPQQVFGYLSDSARIDESTGRGARFVAGAVPSASKGAKGSNLLLIGNSEEWSGIGNWKPRPRSADRVSLRSFARATIRRSLCRWPTTRLRGLHLVDHFFERDGSADRLAH